MRKKKLTLLFLEGIFEQNAKKRFFKGDFSDFNDSQGPDLSRVLHLKFLIIFIAVLILIRLFQLTVFEGKKNRELAENNRIRYVTVEAPRGKILDRNGEVLATSAVKFFLVSDDSRVEVSESQLAQLEKSGIAGFDFSGELGRVGRETVRLYPFGPETSHVLGYISLVQPEDLSGDSDLSNLDNVGRLGLEETYDEVLRGQNGARIIEVDATSRVISRLGEKEAIGGQDIRLTLDLNLQRKVYKALASQIKKVAAKGGAVVVSDVENGAILAMVSYPSFDPNDIGQAVVSEAKPLFNRVISGTYPPGSVFKPVSAIAGLVSGKINKDTQIEDVGEFSIGEFKFANWYFLNYGRRDGILKIDRAIARSNDIFFYRVGEMVGLRSLHEMAIKLGFGQKTGIDLPNESFGLVPDDVWKQSAFSEGWFLGDTMHMAIGQGFLLATPLQVNNMTTTIANGGKLYKPHLVVGVRKTDQEEISINLDVGRATIDAETLLLIHQGMLQACEKGGTAWPFFEASYRVGCKTGTAEKTLGNPHAWFTAFAPFEEPKIAITVIIEEGGEGSTVAAPVAREILDWYFQKH